MPKLTPFQKDVYAATMEIPLGRTRSYGWVARRIGSSRSSRAVGNALNKNPYAPFVPCHRVIASDGSLGGFRGGLRKKVRLLEQERKYLIPLPEFHGHARGVPVPLLRIPCLSRPLARTGEAPSTLLEDGKRRPSTWFDYAHHKWFDYAHHKWFDYAHHKPLKAES